MDRPQILIPSHPTRKDPPMNIKEETRKMKLASPILLRLRLKKGITHSPSSVNRSLQAKKRSLPPITKTSRWQKKAASPLPSRSASNSMKESSLTWKQSSPASSLCRIRSIA